MTNVKKGSLAGVLIALGVVCSAFYIPIGAAKCFPVQHMVNVIAGVLLGPAYGVAMAFVTSLLRVMLGTGSLLAFPGSMVGAFCCGMLYKYTRRLWTAYLGEVIGTGILGALLAYPVAAWMMGKEAAVFAYVIPFIVSSAGGATISILVISALQKTGVFGEAQVALHQK